MASPTCCAGEDSSPCCPGPTLMAMLAEQFQKGYAAALSKPEVDEQRAQAWDEGHYAHRAEQWFNPYRD